MRLLVCGGGTGGHIYPALAVIRELQDMGMSTSNLLWVGTRHQMEEELVPAAGLRLHTISGGPVVGLPFRQRVSGLLGLARGFAEAMGILAEFRPHGLLLTGGYVNVPVALAAWLRRVPSIIFLPDIEPGAAIKFLVGFAHKVATTTADSIEYIPDEKMVVTGYPVRTELREALQLTQANARIHFGLHPDRQTLFVFGGSRGARSINQALMAILPQLPASLQVIHVSGALTWPEVEAYAASLPAQLQARYRAYPFLTNDMGVAFRAATLAVARAGASMLGECPAFSLPAILIPYPYAWRYQKVNAEYLVAHGAAIRIADETLDSELLPTLVQLLQDADRLRHMSQAAGRLDRIDAAKQLAQLVMDLEKDGHG